MVMTTDTEAMYASITQKLESDPNLSLNIWISPSDRGISNSRRVAIMEPDISREGEVVRIDSAHLSGPRKPIFEYDFGTRDVEEGLTLLERTCEGESQLKGSINFNSKFGEEEIHGYPVSHGGLEDWLFNGFNFRVVSRNGCLAAEMQIFMVVMALYLLGLFLLLEME